MWFGIAYILQQFVIKAQSKSIIRILLLLNEHIHYVILSHFCSFQKMACTCHSISLACHCNGLHVSTSLPFKHAAMQLFLRKEKYLLAENLSENYQTGLETQPSLVLMVHQGLVSRP